MHRKHQKISRIILICFIGIWIYFIGFAVLNMIYPDLRDNYAGSAGLKYSKMLYELSESFFILGCTLTGTVFAELGETIPSSGFTMLAIAHGIFFSSTFEIDTADYGKAVEIFVAGLLLFMPAMIMVSNFREFPKWMRYLGIISCLPFVMNMIYYFQGRIDPQSQEPVGAIAFFLLNCTTTIWGFRIGKILRSNAKAVDAGQENREINR